MQTMQLYKSEMSKFEWSDKKKGILVAGEGVSGIVLPSDDSPVEDLVGSERPSSEPVEVTVGSLWKFRANRPQYTNPETGGEFVFIVSDESSPL